MDKDKTYTQHKIRQEEKAAEKEARIAISEIIESQKNFAMKQIREKITLKNEEMKDIIAQVEFENFIFTQILKANKSQYPYLYRSIFGEE